MKLKPFLHATATLVGLILGVGIFGVPYVIAKSGFAIGLFWIVLLGVVTIFLHYLYGLLVCLTPGKHRFPGYIQYALGRDWKKFALVLEIFRFWGLQLAYIIVGGTFLSILLGVGSFIGSMVVFAFVSIVTFFGLKMVDKVEFYMTWVMVGSFLLIVLKGIPNIEIENLLSISSANWFFPYGIILASLSGIAAIPEIWDIAKRDKKTFNWAIVVGTVIPIVITILFAWAVVGVTGLNTSEEAISGLRNILGNWVAYFGAFIGLFAIVTSYLVLALYLQEMLKYDFLVKHIPAWVVAVCTPLALFLIVSPSFISVVDLIGSVLIGGGSVLTIYASLKLVNQRKLKFRSAIVAIGIIVAVLLLIGCAQKIIELI